MGPLLYSICLFICSALALQTSPNEDFYHAAVVEYCPIEGADGNETLYLNADEFVRIIKAVADSADIVVFPEEGLHYEDLNEYISIPIESTAPVADNPDAHPVLRMLSKAAIDNNIYLSIALHEKDESDDKGLLKFNTNIIIDRKGVIIARYRKFNLFHEPMNVTSEPEAVYFDTDFGVRFGIFVCFDMFFKDPALKLVNEKQITDFIFPSWWFAELPFFVSSPMHMGWAYMTDANLLSAGINSLHQGSTGSGIYNGRKGPAVYFFNERNETRILTAKLYKKGKAGQSEGKVWEPLRQGVDADITLWVENLQLYKTELLTPQLENTKLEKGNGDELTVARNINKKLCQGSLCCEFSINATFTYLPQDKLQMSDLSYRKSDSYYHYQYRMAVFNGIRDGIRPGVRTTGIQVCGIMPCMKDSQSSCARITGGVEPLKVDYNGEKIFLYSTQFNDVKLKAISTEKTDFSYPNILVSSDSSNEKAFGALPDVSKINFNTDGYTSEFHFAHDRLVEGAIYSRIGSRDGGEIGVASNE